MIYHLCVIISKRWPQWVSLTLYTILQLHHNGAWDKGNHSRSYHRQASNFMELKHNGETDIYLDCGQTFKVENSWDLHRWHQIWVFLGKWSCDMVYCYNGNAVTSIEVITTNMVSHFADPKKANSGLWVFNTVWTCGMVPKTCPRKVAVSLISHWDYCIWEFMKKICYVTQDVSKQFLFFYSKKQQ